MTHTHTADRKTAKQGLTDYLLGYTDSEQERLIRQAAKLTPITERFFREAGIGSGQRVLDLGSGMGDVAMLVARLVGPSGEVVGVERDTNSIARARARAAAAGLRNVSFLNSDVNNIVSNQPFDAAVGRWAGSPRRRDCLPGTVLGSNACPWQRATPLVSHASLDP